MNNIFQHAYQEGKIPDKDTGKYLVEQLGEVNYIPPNSVREYQYAVLKQYEEYFQLMERRKAQTQDASKEK